MANRTAWTPGNNPVGNTYATLINSADMSTLANGSTVLSSVATIANDTYQDMYMDISFQFVIASSTVAINASFSFWLYYLNQNSVQFGDNQLTAGTPAAITPVFTASAIIPVPAGAATTNMYGSYTGILLAPRSFRVAVQNNCGFTLAGTQTCKYAVYNINLNN